MRYFVLVVIIFLLSQKSQSQIYEIGVFAGASNFIGDVGATDYISPNALALGAVLKWNRSPRHSWRVSLTYADLEGQDSQSDDPRRQLRDYEFDNSVLEISAGMEFTFWEFNLHETERQFAPYIFTGISTALHDNYFFDTNGEYTSENASSWAFGIPIALGAKANIARHFVLGFELGARYTFSDELDGSVPSDPSLQNLSFGNTNSNDWYVFTGFTLTYTFGQRPCYCNF